MRRLLVGAVVLLTAVTGTTGSVGARTSRWTVRDLGTLGGSWSKAVALNDQGGVVGWSELKRTGRPYEPLEHAFLWANGRMRSLGTVWQSSTSVSRAVAITDDGVVLGNSQDLVSDPPHSAAFVWKSGRLTSLPELSWGAGINESGKVVGQVTAAGIDEGEAFMWQNGKITFLGTVAGRSYSSADAVNERGQVVGESYGIPQMMSPEHVRSRAFLWQKGQMTDLGVLPGMKECRAFGINERSQVIGTCRNGSKNAAGFVWQAGKMTRIDGTPTAINGRGQIVGSSSSHAFLWQSGRMTNLGVLPGTTRSNAIAINDRGQVLGTSGAHVVVWQSGRISDLGRGNPVAINGLGQVVGSQHGHAVLWTLRSD